MDFVLDPAVAAATVKSANNSSETLTEKNKGANAADAPSAQAAPATSVPEGAGSTGSTENTEGKTPEEVEKLNKKTEEEFNKLEDRIEETYNLVQKTTSGWGSSLSGFFSKVKIPEALNIQETQKKLEELRVAFPEAVAQRKKQVEEIAAKGGKQINEQFTNFSKSLSEQEAENEKEAAADNNTKNEKGPKKMLDILSNATNSYLDDLDHELEQVEKFSLNYATKFGTFIKKNILETDAQLREKLVDEANKGDLDEAEASVLFNVPENIKTPIYATRTEAQLHALHTSQDLYVTDALDSQFAEFQKTFNLDQKTDEISGLLKKHSHLQNLMALLVPAKVPYEEFWARYYYMYGQIIEQEEKRKNLLSTDAAGDEDEDFNWDDEDEDEEQGATSASKNGAKELATADSKSKDAEKLKAPGNAESRTSSELTYDLKSTNSSTLDVVASKKSDKPQPPVSSSTANSADDDDDDDWE